MSSRLTDQVPELESDFIVADDDYFRAKARRCYRLAAQTSDQGAARTLATLGDAFEEKARACARRGYQ